ncbi:unnamed protein product, partial [Brachionus calyciflorus]
MLRIFSILIVLASTFNCLPEQYWNQESAVGSQQKQQDQSKHFFLNQPAPVVVPVPAPLPAPAGIIPAFPLVVPSGPYPIQSPTITSNGETIIETLVGGLPFNCLGKPTGHYRDNHFCDVFHACVYGQQRKTYSCPFVGEAQYFDDVTRRCEF